MDYALLYAVRTHETPPMTRRRLSHRLTWFPQRQCFRFRFRDPHTDALRYCYCMPERFREARIPIESDDVVRKNTKKAEQLAKRLRAAVLETMAHIVPDEMGAAQTPLVSRAAAAFMEMNDHQDEGYRRAIARILAEFAESVDDKPCAELEDADLKRFEKRYDDHAPSTKRRYMTYVGMLTNFVVAKRWVSVDPRATYKAPKVPESEANPFTMTEVSTFFDQVAKGRPFTRGGRITSRRKDLWAHLEWVGIGLVSLGLRQVEMVQAEWEKVDWKNRLLFIDKSHGAKERHARGWQPVPLIAWPFFESHRQSSGLIWTQPEGKPIDNRHLGTIGRHIARHIIPGFQWRRFRSTYASFLTQRGVESGTVSRLLRHSTGGPSSSVAEQHYIRRDLLYLRDVVDDAFQAFAGVGPFPEASGRGRRMRSEERR